ncbi:Fic family protein [Clostridium neuense]|uniref:Fic family protein n=1 Tax=Clostridium neuense TaxID=1728934 RepID=A0ABW8TEI7_9CLOT
MYYSESVKVWRTKNKEEALRDFFIKFIYCSNKIENDEVRLVDVEAVVNEEKINYFSESERNIIEIKKHIELYKDIIKLDGNIKEKLDMDIIKRVYFCFTGNKLAKDIYKSIDELVQDINNMQINEETALDVVSYFCCYFEEIINCEDGRVVRILINYILIANNLAPINIFYYNKEEYYLALESFYKNKKIDRMRKFLDDQAYKTWIKNYNLKLKSLKGFLKGCSN